MTRVIIFATYPIANPQHGGQKRARAIFDCYNNTKDIESKFCAVYFPLHYEDAWPSDIPIPTKYSSLMASNPLTGDIITGKLISDDKFIKNKIIKIISEFKPNIIHIEQPFVYIGLKKILSDISYKGKIVFGSQNVEYPMKKEMLENENYDENEIKKLVTEIKDVEISLCKDADLILAVSEGDIESYVKDGVQRNKLILARNGIEESMPNDSEKRYWKTHFENIGVNKVAVFIGSAHPPNWTGFQKMVGSKVGFLGHDERIVLAGSIGEYFRDSYTFNTEVERVVFWKRVIATGRLSEDRLAGLLDRADCLLLPIQEGGGSNLKTAEALLSKKPVVATTHALRSFEDYAKYPTIKVSDSPKKYRELIREAFSAKIPILSAKQVMNLEKVTWAACLQEAIKGVSKL